MEERYLVFWEYICFSEVDFNRERVVREGFLEEVMFELRFEVWIRVS